jgi:hypothetical protein
MLDIKDRVYCKYTGGGHIGQVIGKVTGEYYSTVNPYSMFPNQWDTLFPNWREENIIFIKLDIPERACTFKEFTESLKREYPNIKLDDENTQKLYIDKVSFTSIVACPEAGVFPEGE